MAEKNIGKVKFGSLIHHPDKTEEFIEWADIIFATGSTFVNDTAEIFIDRGKPVVFYGVTGAGPAFLLGQERYCPCGY